MQRVLNKFENRDDYSVLILESNKYNPVEVKVDTALVPRLLDYTWCYEQSRGRIYTTCLDMKLPTYLGYANCHIPLHKMVAWLHTNTPLVRVVKRKNFDLRIKSMTLYTSPKLYP